MIYCATAECQISALRGLAYVLDLPRLNAIYNSFISPHFNNCPTVWIFTTGASIQKVEHIKSVHADSSFGTRHRTTRSFIKLMSILLEYIHWKDGQWNIKDRKWLPPVICQPCLKCLKIYTIWVTKQTSTKSALNYIWIEFFKVFWLPHLQFACNAYQMSLPEFKELLIKWLAY